MNHCEPVMQSPAPIEHNAPAAASTPNNNNGNTEVDIYSDPDTLSQNLNAVVLQYLECCGLEESYSTFCKECENRGVPFPKDLPTPRFPKSNFSQIDGKKLLQHFDAEDGDELMNMWTTFSQDLDPAEKQTIGTITFYLQIYLAVIPYRQNKCEADKSNGMAALRQFFQDKSHEFSADSNMLSLFALPFVPNPMIHPIFKDVFQDPWKDKLKCQVGGALSHHLGTHKKEIPGCNSELTQMFLSYIQESDEETEDEDGLTSVSRRCPIENTNTNTQTNPGQKVNRQEQELAIASTIQINESLQSAYAQNHKLNREIQQVRKKMYYVEDRYYKLIKSTAEVVCSLELAVQGKFQNIEELRDRLQFVFPELFSGQSKGYGGPQEPINEADLDSDEEEESLWKQDSPHQSCSSESDGDKPLPNAIVQEVVHEDKPRITSPRARSKIPKKNQQSNQCNNNPSQSQSTEVDHHHARSKQGSNVPAANRSKPSRLQPVDSISEFLPLKESSNSDPQLRPDKSVPVGRAPPSPSLQNVHHIKVPSTKDLYAQLNFQPTRNRSPHTQRASVNNCLSQQTFIMEDRPGPTVPTNNAKDVKVLKYPKIAETSPRNLNQHCYNSNQTVPAQLQGRPAISICPNNLRTHFEPVTAGKTGCTAINKANLADCLRTQTRTIRSDEQTDGSKVVATKVKKTFRRSLKKVEKNEDTSEDIEANRPRRKWLDTDAPNSVESDVPGSNYARIGKTIAKQTIISPASAPGGASQTMLGGAHHLGFGLDHKSMAKKTQDSVKGIPRPQASTKESRKAKGIPGKNTSNMV